MKKLMLIISLITLLLASSMAQGVESTTVAAPSFSHDGNKAVITITWVTAADGSLASTTLLTTSHLRGLQGWYLYAVETYPGGTAPTNAYVITIKDSAGFDLAAGKIIGSATVPAVAFCYQAGGSFLPVFGNLVFALTGNIVNSATGTAKLFFVVQ